MSIICRCTDCCSNEMDNKIVKALEKEIRLAEYFDGFSADNVDCELLKSTLDLIKRQQAEIEKLKGEILNGHESKSN